MRPACLCASLFFLLAYSPTPAPAAHSPTPAPAAHSPTHRPRGSLPTHRPLARSPTHRPLARSPTNPPPLCLLAHPLPPLRSHTIKTFGALLFATVMTTRQFISILLSCILFAHPLTAGRRVQGVASDAARAAAMPLPARSPRRLLAVAALTSLQAVPTCTSAARHPPPHPAPLHPHPHHRVVQWLGTVMVFGALYYKSLARGGSHGKPKAADAAHDGPGGDAEKLPLVSSGAVGDAEATEGAAPLK